MNFGDESAEPSSMVPTILYGAAIGVLLCVVFFLSYLAAPNLPIAGTSVIAVLVMAAIVGVIAYLTRGQVVFDPAPIEESTAAVRSAVGEETPSRNDPVESAPNRDPPSSEVLAEEMEARLARLQNETKSLDRVKQFAEWADKMLAVGALHQNLGQHQINNPGKRGAGQALGNYRLASNAFRRVADTRAAKRFPRQWVGARIGFAECMLVLGSAEDSREHLEEAASGFAGVLEMSELEAAERDRATIGLQRTQSALAESTITRVESGDELF